MGTEHTLGKDQNHTHWDNSLQPALEIERGDVVVFDCEEVSGGQVTEAVFRTPSAPSTWGGSIR